MMLLALHTSGSEGSVALARCSEGTAQILGLQHLRAKTFVADLVPAIQRALKDAAVDWSSVEAIAVTTGPGSFTGIRIGMATAKGLAEPKRLPIIPVSSLALPAMRMPQARSVLDAGRTDFYAGEFSQRGQQCAWERWLTREQLLQAPLLDGVVYITPETEAAETLQENGQTVLLCAVPDAAAVAKWAAQRIAQPGFDPQAYAWETADGNYLRRPEAEIKLEAAR